MSFHKTFGTDKNMESGEGIILDYGKDGRIKIHRAGGSNLRFSQVMAQKSRPYARQLAVDNLDEEISRRVMAEVYAETVVIGWDGVKDENDQDLPYSKEACVKLFLEVPELFLNVKAAALDAAQFRRIEKEDNLKK